MYEVILKVGTKSHLCWTEFQVSLGSRLRSNGDICNITSRKLVLSTLEENLYRGEPVLQCPRLEIVRLVILICTGVHKYIIWFSYFHHYLWPYSVLYRLFPTQRHVTPRFMKVLINFILLRHYLFLEVHCFLRASLLESCSLLGTDNIRRQITGHIFLSNF